MSETAKAVTRTLRRDARARAREAAAAALAAAEAEDLETDLFEKSPALTPPRLSASPGPPPLFLAERQVAQAAIQLEQQQQQHRPLGQASRWSREPRLPAPFPLAGGPRPRPSEVLIAGSSDESLADAYWRDSNSSVPSVAAVDDTSASPFLTKSITPLGVVSPTEGGGRSSRGAGGLLSPASFLAHQAHMAALRAGGVEGAATTQRQQQGGGGGNPVVVGDGGPRGSKWREGGASPFPSSWSSSSSSSPHPPSPSQPFPSLSSSDSSGGGAGAAHFHGGEAAARGRGRNGSYMEMQPLEMEGGGLVGSSHAAHRAPPAVWGYGDDFSDEGEEEEGGDDDEDMGGDSVGGAPLQIDEALLDDTAAALQPIFFTLLIKRRNGRKHHSHRW